MIRENGNGDKTFIRITNKDIYDKLETLDGKLETLETKVSAYGKSNELALAGICEKNEVAHTKMWGKINLQQWMILAALAVASTAIVWLWEIAKI